MLLFLQIFITIIISLLIIYSIHYVWDQLKNNYSTKKTRDLVNIQMNKYHKIIEDMNNEKEKHTPVTQLDKNDIEKLNADLETFINTQVQNSENF
jgi:predicted PurR-regulated permease PerM